MYTTKCNSRLRVTCDCDSEAENCDTQYGDGCQGNDSKIAAAGYGSVAEISVADVVVGGLDTEKSRQPTHTLAGGLIISDQLLLVTNKQRTSSHKPRDLYTALPIPTINSQLGVISMYLRCETL